MCIGDVANFDIFGIVDFHQERTAGDGVVADFDVNGMVANFGGVELNLVSIEVVTIDDGLQLVMRRAKDGHRVLIQQSTVGVDRELSHLVDGHLLQPLHHHFFRVQNATLEGRI